MTSSSSPAEITETRALSTSKGTSHRFNPQLLQNCRIDQTYAQVFVPKQRKYLVVFPEGGFLHKRKEVCIQHTFQIFVLLKFANLCQKWCRPCNDHNFRQATDLQLNWVSHHWSTALFPGFSPMMIIIIFMPWINTALPSSATHISHHQHQHNLYHGLKPSSSLKCIITCHL